MTRRISIDPVTRLEGHGRIEIFLDDAGDVANVYFQVPELRGFERFCVGRQAEDMPVLTSRICGICPEAHHLAATKALDDLFEVAPPPAARKLRELLYMAFFVADHTTHFYLLGGPDFIVGPDAPASERNLLGVIRKLGTEAGRTVMECRARNHEAIRILGGRGVNPVAGLPGGWSQPLSEKDRQTLERTARANVTFAFESLRTFDEVVLANPAYVEMLRSESYCHRTYSMGTVDPFNRANFYDGLIRIVDPTGRELVQFPCRDYARHIAERTEPWSYLKFPYLEAVGWKGFVDGVESGIYCATPLSRLNVSDSLPTPMAQEHFERFYEAMGSTNSGSTTTGQSTAAGQSAAAGGLSATGTRRAPVHHRLATHWARLIELLMAAERMVELVRDPEITSREIRNLPSGRINPRGGVGSVEAPRGTLIHHYEAGERGILTRVNLIVGTTNNHAPMAMSLKRAAERLIHRGVIVEQGLLNRIEMAFRLYDPCLSCATHALPGHMPLEVLIREPDGVVRRRLTREGGQDSCGAR